MVENDNFGHFIFVWIIGGKRGMKSDAKIDELRFSFGQFSSKANEFSLVSRIKSIWNLSKTSEK